MREMGCRSVGPLMMMMMMCEHCFLFRLFFPVYKTHIVVCTQQAHRKIQFRRSVSNDRRVVVRRAGRVMADGTEGEACVCLSWKVR